MDLAVWIEVHLVTWLAVESLSECSSISSVSHACARHATSRDAVTWLALEAVHTLSPPVASFPLVCRHIVQQFYTQCVLTQCNYTRCVGQVRAVSFLLHGAKRRLPEETRQQIDERTALERCNDISDLLRAVWDVPPCCLVGINRRFGEPYCHRLHGRKEYPESGSSTVLWNVV
jgi:hypothetical protein